MSNAYEVAEILAKAHDLPPVAPKRAKPTRHDDSGAPYYSGASLLTSATSEVLDTYHGVWESDEVPDAFARALCSANPRAGNLCAGNQLAFADGTGWRPFVGADSATAERPAWSDLVRSVWPDRRGQQCVVMIVDDFKKRLWPFARAGVLGSRTPVYIHDMRYHMLDAVVSVDWARMLDCLALVESVYTSGFSKHAIQGGLMSAHQVAREVGLRETLALDRAVAVWRDTPEFRVALVIAQKGEG